MSSNNVAIVIACISAAVSLTAAFGVEWLRQRSNSAKLAQALVLGQREELRPGHAHRHSQGTEYFQHVGQLPGKVAGGSVACLLSLFDETVAMV